MIRRLWLDSTVARNTGQVRELAELADPKGIVLVVPAHIHLEQCRHQRSECKERGTEFSLEVFDGFLEQLHVQVVELTLKKELAERWGERLHRRFSTRDQWRAAKLSSIRAKLAESAAVSTKRPPMTTDWLVALQIEDDQDGLVVTDDKGPEWDALRTSNKAKSFDQAKEWLSRLPTAPVD
jgi:hypothetical protein